MRESCRSCVLKHLAKASILLTESRLGYPEHFYLALGNLSEAEEECVGWNQKLAADIRELRLDIESHSDKDGDIIEMIKRVVKEWVVEEVVEKGIEIECSRCGAKGGHPTPIGSYSFLCDKCLKETGL